MCRSVSSRLSRTPQVCSGSTNSSRPWRARQLWLTDAYYGGTAPYVNALRAAARDGVDVRLLVPGASDIPLVRLFSRAGYRPLLEGGIRVYEWNGSMIHAKTAVADGRWARVGSTNLNVASWLGNRELDVIVEHEPFAREMEEMFLRDLEMRPRSCCSATGFARQGALPRIFGDEWREQRWPRYGRSGASRQHGRGGYYQHARARGGRVEHRADRRDGSRRVAALAFKYPRAIAYPIGVFAAWVAAAILYRGIELYRNRRRTVNATPNRNRAHDTRSVSTVEPNPRTPSK